MKFEHPHKVDNGSGEEITFVRLIDDGAGGALEIHNRVHPGSGPPMHVHHLQDESLTVVRGRMAAQIEGQPPVFLGPGETATFRRGEIHRFWNAGDEDLLCQGWARPACNLEYFLTQIYESTKANGGKEPSMFDGAFLLTRYKSEFDLMVIPPFVKRFIFPFTVLIGKLMGKYRKFEGAPEALKG